MREVGRISFALKEGGYLGKLFILGGEFYSSDNGRKEVNLREEKDGVVCYFNEFAGNSKCVHFADGFSVSPQVFD